MSDKNNLHDGRNDRRYFSMNPNFTCFLGLDPYAGWLYMHLLCAARAESHVEISTRRLSKLSGMSVGAVSKAKQTLAEVGLIFIEPKAADDRSTDDIHILDVWTRNVDFFSGLGSGAIEPGSARLPRCSSHEHTKDDSKNHNEHRQGDGCSSHEHRRSPNKRQRSPDEQFLYNKDIYTDCLDGNKENNKVGTPTEPEPPATVAESGTVLEPLPQQAIEAPGAANPKNEPPMSAAEWHSFTNALLWVCYDHEDMSMLTATSRKELFAEAKRIAAAGYTIDDLRNWFATKWKHRNDYKRSGHRPRPCQVRELIPCVRDRGRILSSNYAVPRPEPSPAPIFAPATSETTDGGSKDDAWEQMVRWHFQGAHQADVREIAVLDVYEQDGARVYAVDGGVRRDWLENRMGKAIERELRSILKQSVRVVFFVKGGEIEGEGTAQLVTSGVGSIFLGDGNHLEVQGSSDDEEVDSRTAAISTQVGPTCVPARHARRDASFSIATDRGERVAASPMGSS